jgi:hypothetical protein
MTCSPVTKQLNGWNLSYRSSHPNVWYVLVIPACAGPNHHHSFIPTAGMIPPGQASPAVGMAGITWAWSSRGARVTVAGLLGAPEVLAIALDDG